MSDEIISAIPELVATPEGETPELDSKNLTHVKLPVFEGPLDLLLYLIKKDELDIYDIPIETITSQYLDYLRIIKMLDLEVAGDYLVVAATLLYIKSRVLLPHDQRPPEEEAEEDDPRWELVRQLVEYKKYKDAAFELQQCLVRQEGLHGRGTQSKPDMELDGSMPFDKVGLFDLLSVFQKILSRADKNEDLRDIFEDKFTVSDKIQFILGTMTSRSRVVFEELFTDGATRTEVVVTFLAVLELIRLKQVGVTQDGVFGSIELVKLASTHSDFAGFSDAGEVAAEAPAVVEASSEEVLPEETPVEAAVSEEASTEEASSEEAPVETVTTESASPEETAEETEPAEEATVEAVPAETTPTEDAPAETVPEEEASPAGTSEEETPAEEASTEDAPSKKAAEEEKPASE